MSAKEGLSHTRVEQAELGHSLYTIGYGSRTMEALLEVLRAHRIQCLIDVRSAPYSKFKPEFSKVPLEAALKIKGIQYVFLGDLLGGQPPDPDCYRDGKVDYARVRGKPYFLAGLEKVREISEQGIRAVLMCSEGRPEQCHRTKLIGEELTGAGVRICHIDEDGRLCSQTEVIDRLTGGQLDLFGTPAFTSRKRYPTGSDREGEGG